MQKIDGFLRSFVAISGDEAARLRAQLGADRPEPAPAAQRQRKARAKRATKRLENIAVLDMETDPFDNTRPDQEIRPFLAVLYSDNFDPIVIWRNDYEEFCSELLAAINDLPGKYTIYAHNGGKFDFMFLVHALRGTVKFKGRGIMSAHIGEHEIRDSFHIIPERLAAYKKDDFDYTTLTKTARAKHKDAIIKYCISDCVYLLDLVKKFLGEFGFKISVGAAAQAKLGEHYSVAHISAIQDENLRPFYMGGRVECLAGALHTKEHLFAYDINSAYPHAMSAMRHPIGSEYFPRIGKPGENTAFLIVECDNDGVLLGRDETGALTSQIRRGIFHATIHEYRAALALDKIRNVSVLQCVDCAQWSDFSNFIDPLYARRREEKIRLKTLAAGTPEYDQCAANMLFLKLIMNNAYGRFALNPRRYREHYISDPGVEPSDGENWGDASGGMPDYMGARHWIWSRPSPSQRYNNVGVAASITGAVRAELMQRIALSKRPIYCDTDSLICGEMDGSARLDNAELGAWACEAELRECVIAGKKLYGYRTVDGAEKIRAKGASGISWQNLIGLLAGERYVSVARGVTMTRRGDQFYMSREIRRTAKFSSEGKAQ